MNHFDRASALEYIGGNMNAVFDANDVLIAPAQQKIRALLKQTLADLADLCFQAKRAH